MTTKDRIILLLKTVGSGDNQWWFLLGFCWVFGNYIMFIAGGSQTSQTMHIPMWIVYFPVLIGSLYYGVAWGIQILCNIWPVSV